MPSETTERKQVLDIRHIVFDIGKVLIHYDPEIPFKRIIADDNERAWFFENVCTGPWNIEQDRGRSWAEAEALLIDAHPHQADNIRAFRRHWHEMVPYHYEPSVAALNRLIDDGHDVTMLTNFASDTFREAKEKFAFLKRPRGVTVSGDIGLIKPDPAIFERHSSDFNLDPEAVLFIDDSAPNVEAARNAGWQAIHLTDPADIETGLARYGLSAGKNRF